MTREQLEHIIRASAVIADDDEIVIVGSQSILGQYPEAPPALLRSIEADVYPKNHPDRADLIDGSIGELSPFHDTFGYYAQGVGPTTAVLAPDWESRMTPIKNANTRGATGWCIDLHDAVVAKLVAGREKDIQFYRDALQSGLVQHETLLKRANAVCVKDAVRQAIIGRIRNG